MTRARPGLTLIETLCAAALLAFAASSLTPLLRPSPARTQRDALGALARDVDAILAADTGALNTLLSREPALTLNQSPDGPITLRRLSAAPHAHWWVFERAGTFILRWRPQGPLALPTPHLTPGEPQP